jgi:hypothetical protein
MPLLWRCERCNAILKNDYGTAIVGNAIMTVVFLLPGIPLLYTGLRKEKTKT